MDTDAWATYGISKLERTILLNGAVAVELVWYPTRASAARHSLSFDFPPRGDHEMNVVVVGEVDTESLPTDGWSWFVTRHQAFSPQRGSRKLWYESREEQFDWGSISTRLAVSPLEELETTGLEARIKHLGVGDAVTIEAWNKDARIGGARTIVGGAHEHVELLASGLAPVELTIVDADSHQPLSGRHTAIHVKHDADDSCADSFLAGAWNRRLEVILDASGSARFDLIDRPKPRSSGLAAPCSPPALRIDVPGYETCVLPAVSLRGREATLITASAKKRSSLFCLVDDCGFEIPHDRSFFATADGAVLVDSELSVQRDNSIELCVVGRHDEPERMPVVPDEFLLSDLGSFGIGVERVDGAGLRAVPLAARVVRFVNFPGDRADEVQLEWTWRGHGSNWGKMSAATMRLDGGTRERLVAPADAVELHLGFWRGGTLSSRTELPLPATDCVVDLAAREVQLSR